MPAKSNESIGGPFLAAAFFCEKVLQEKDGVLTAVRIIDTVVADIVADTVSGEALQAITPIRFRRQLSVLLSFKSGDVTGKRTVRVVCKTLAVDQSMPVVLEGEHHGVNLLLNLGLELSDGVHWFDVSLGGKLVTKMPLHVTIRLRQPDTTAAESQTTSPQSTNSSQ